MNELSHVGARVTGVVMTAVIVFLFDTQSTAVLHALILPLLLAVAAWLMTRSLMAVAFASFTMAAINTDFSAGWWIPSLAYPAIAVIALIVCLVIGFRRFRQRINDTHEERWARRRAGDPNRQDGTSDR